MSAVRQPLSPLHPVHLLLIPGRRSALSLLLHCHLRKREQAGDVEKRPICQPIVSRREPVQGIEKPPRLSAAALVRAAFAAYTAATLLLGVIVLLLPLLPLPPAGQNGPEQLADDCSERQDEKSAGHRGVPRHDADRG